MIKIYLEYANLVLQVLGQVYVQRLMRQNCTISGQNDHLSIFHGLESFYIVFNHNRMWVMFLFGEDDLDITQII